MICPTRGSYTRLADVLPLSSHQGPQETFMMFPERRARRCQSPSWIRARSSPSYLGAAAVQKPMSRLCEPRTSQRGADLDDDLKPLTKRPRVEITVDNDSSDKSDGEDVYRDFDI